MEYEAALYQWINSFKATWPSLLKEPESERIKVEEVKFKSAMGVVEIILPIADPDNKAMTIKWLADTVNEAKELFLVPLELDYEALAAYEPPTPEFGNADQQVPSPPKMGKGDSASPDEGVQNRILRIEQFLGGRTGKAIAQIASSRGGH